MIFEQLGPYRLQERLGQGGMGAVYAAVHEETGEPVALKLLAPGLCDDEHFRDRFAVEIETLRTLNHPNIVRLLGFGRQQGQLYYAMERVEGRSLQSELQAGRRFAWREAVEIGLQVCAALKHAHDHGVVHRDLKPGNLLITPRGEVKLADFGIAKLFGGTQLTATGGTLGTADYMAPEQADGRPVGPRGDLYSLGSVLFTLAAGRPPFQGKTLPQLIHQVRFAEPPELRNLAPEIPLELETIVRQLLAKDPQQRIPTARALAARLEALLEGEAVTAGPSASPAPPPARQGGEPSVPSAAPSEEEASPAIDTRTAPAEAEAPEPEATAPRRRRETPPADVFIPVSPRPAAEPAAESSAVPVRTLLATALLLVLVMVGSLWYALRPPTADQLLLRIEQQRAARSPRGEVLEELVGEFLERFPEDRRARELRRLQEELDLARYERRLLREVDLPDGARSLSPVELLTRDALLLVERDPREAARRLAAIVELHEGDGAAATPRALDLAKRRLTELEARAAARGALRGEHLREEMRRTAELAAEDPPAARRRYAALLTLYEQESWAAHELAELRRRLEELSP